MTHTDAKKKKKAASQLVFFHLTEDTAVTLLDHSIPSIVISYT